MFAVSWLVAGRCEALSLGSFLLFLCLSQALQQQSSESHSGVPTFRPFMVIARSVFTCLGKGHNSEQCEKSCRKHHQSIWPELNVNSPHNHNKPPLSASGDQGVRDAEATGTTTATTTSEKVKPKHRVLLDGHCNRHK